MAKPGPAKGSPSAKQSGGQGGKSRPSLKQGTHKQGARHSVQKGRPNK
jgi:hypothetical protein